MAKRKKKKKKKPASKLSFSFSGSRKKKTKPKKKISGAKFNFRIPLKIFVIVIATALICVGFIFLEKHVKNLPEISNKTGTLELLNPPEWIDCQSIRDKIIKAAGGEWFTLDTKSAKLVAENLQTLPWLYNVRAQTTAKTIKIYADYRKPVAFIKYSDRTYYVAWINRNDPLYNDSRKMVAILDYIPIDTLTIVEIKNFIAQSIPSVGKGWHQDDVISAVELIGALSRMDASYTPDNPLLKEVDNIDVSNFNGRKSSGNSHIVINIKDGTQILWGACYGQASRYEEPAEKEKIADLYKIFEQYGTVQGSSKYFRYIDLRYPYRNMPRPEE